jgi:hypothetical protein
MEEQDSVGHISDLGQPVGRDDRGRSGQAGLTNEVWATRTAAYSTLVVDEEQEVGPHRDLVEVVSVDEQWFEGALDRTSVRAA